MKPLGLALIGARGSGKSTVGRLLADRLKRRFADVDDYVEAALGRPITAIFAELGEPAFRDAEEAAIAELTSIGPEIVLATGGGAILRASNRERLRSFGLVVWLTAETSALGERISADASIGRARPSLTGAGTIAEIETVVESRRGYYEEVSGLVVDTTSIGPDEVAGAILDAFAPALVRSGGRR